MSVSRGNCIVTTMVIRNTTDSTILVRPEYHQQQGFIIIYHHRPILLALTMTIFHYRTMPISAPAPGLDVAAVFAFAILPIRCQRFCYFYFARRFREWNCVQKFAR